MQGPPHILLVEDEDNIAIAIELLLGREGFQVTRVASGAQAMPNILSIRPTLVVLDVTLPEVSGYEVCQQIRRHTEFAQLPILMTSARSSKVEQRKGLALGATAFLAKPFAASDLIDQVKQLAHGATS